ncbi:MAG: deiodinase [Acidobacteriota bacterium]|nr:MAG: deiodinase [Acidobacteriota bacterium]
MPINEREQVVYEDPKDYEDRAELASTCAVKLGIEFPALVDGIDNATEQAYTGWPDRLYLIDKEGRVAYKSAAGPFGFKPSDLEAAINKLR